MNKNLFRAFKDSFKISKGYFMVSLLAGIFDGLNPMIILLSSQYLLNALGDRRPYDVIWNIVILSLLINLVSLILGGTLNFYRTYLGSYHVRKIELIRNNKLIDMDYKYVEDPEIVALRRQISVYGYSTTYSFENIMGQVHTIAKSLVTIIVSLWILMPIFLAKTYTQLDSSLYLLIFIFYVSLSFYLPFLYERRSQEKMKKVEQMGYSDNLFINYLINLLVDVEVGKEIRIYKQEAFFAGLIRNSVKSGERILQAFVAKEMGSALISTLLSQVGSLLLVIFVVLKIVVGGLGTGYVVSSVAALNMFLMSLPLLFITISSLLANTTAIDAHYRYMDLKNQSESGSLPIEKRLDNDFKFIVSDLSFAFPSSEDLTLKNIDVDFENGKSYAIVGENGSGKTTFIKLLTRLYSATGGEISLNEININKYKADEYYSLFNVVFQDFSLFSFTLGETVATSKVYDYPTINAILSEVGLGSKLASMPFGLETIISKAYDPQGIGMSGGEKQKLAIARAVYKDGPLYILDEPTSSLDPISEFEIYEQFNRITKDKTSIFISHRLSSCRFCDEILVFDEGVIVQKGTHDDLVSVRGQYQDLWNAQAQYYVS